MTESAGGGHPALCLEHRAPPCGQSRVGCEVGERGQRVGPGGGLEASAGGVCHRVDLAGDMPHCEEEAAAHLYVSVHTEEGDDEWVSGFVRGEPR